MFWQLIRLIGGSVPVGSHTTLRHSLELKPYIEEPVGMVFPSTGISSDLRPHHRHDFVLATRKSVDEYWNTLEYCYAASDPKAALHAFPGSAVDEVWLLLWLVGRLGKGSIHVTFLAHRIALSRVDPLTL